MKTVKLIAYVPSSGDFFIVEWHGKAVKFRQNPDRLTVRNGDKVTLKLDTRSGTLTRP